MNIIEATKQALPQGKGITRKIWDRQHLLMAIFPTNTSECCIASTLGNHLPKPRWNPTADDLLAEDWKVIEENLANNAL